jgi:hypothetical protein
MQERGRFMSRLIRRIRGAAIGAVSASALMLAAGTAAAQYYPVQPMYPPPPPPYGGFAAHEADAVVRSLGLTPLSAPARRGPFLIVRAMGQEGSHVHVMLDRRTGQVVQIVRAGPGAPRVAVMRPDAPPVYQPGYEDEEPRPYDDDTGYVPAPPSHWQGQGGGAYPAPGAGPRVVTREPDITGSVPRSASRQPVDPLLGVPKEFRGQPSQGASASGESSGAKLAARTPADTPRATPLPRPRPADAPAVAQQQPAPVSAAKPEPPREPAPPPAATPLAKDEYPVQPLE